MGQCFAGGWHWRVAVHQHIAEEANFVAANIQQVAVQQFMLLNGAAVNEGTVGAAQVFDGDFAIFHRQHRMLAADGEVFDHDVVVWTTAQRGALLGESHFLDDGAVNRDDQIRHAGCSWGKGPSLSGDTSRSALPRDDGLALNRNSMKQNRAIPCILQRQ